MEKTVGPMQICSVNAHKSLVLAISSFEIHAAVNFKVFSHLSPHLSVLLTSGNVILQTQTSCKWEPCVKQQTVCLCLRDSRRVSFISLRKDLYLIELIIMWIPSSNDSTHPQHENDCRRDTHTHGRVASAGSQFNNHKTLLSKTCMFGCFLCICPFIHNSLVLWFIPVMLTSNSMLYQIKLKFYGFG